MQIEALRQRLRALGARPVHEQRVLRLWTQAKPQDSGRRRLEDFLPQPLREALPALERELVDAGERYARVTGYPIQYQWTLMEGVNDGDDEIEALAGLLKGRYAVMNLIPFNAVEGLDFRRPSWERAAAMARSLHQRGVLTKLRQSAGQDVEGGCGQLRARAQRPTGRVITVHPAVGEPT